MSAGFGLGNQSCVIGIPKRGGVDIIYNEVSKRQTPAMVAFSSTQRYLGESASTQMMGNIKDTITSLKRLIGRKWSSEDLQQELPYLPFQVTHNSTTNSVLITVNYRNRQHTFTVEEVLAMLLRQLAHIAEMHLNGPLREVVVSVPGFFTSAQRQALLDATKIAGLNCMNLMNEITAVALAYGIYRTDLTEKDPVYVIFVDMGDSSLGVSVVEFIKGKLNIRASAYDRNLGGRDFDRVLCKYFADEFNQKHKMDIYSNTRAKIRLEVQCERLKRVLSANPEAAINVECIMNDMDIHSTIKREKFEQLCSHLLARVRDPIERALKESGVPKEKISVIELVGGGTRIPAVANVVKEIVGINPSRTLNAEEAVAKGCALRCAILSPSFKVRDYEIVEFNLYEVKAKINQKDKEEIIQELFKKNCIVPASKEKKLKEKKPFVVEVGYDENAGIPTGEEPVIGKWRFEKMPVIGMKLDPIIKERSEPGDIHVKFALDQDSILRLEDAYFEETIVYYEKITKKRK